MFLETKIWRSGVVTFYNKNHQLIYKQFIRTYCFYRSTREHNCIEPRRVGDRESYPRAGALQREGPPRGLVQLEEGDPLGDPR